MQYFEAQLLKETVMAQAWVILTDLDGRSISAPNEQQIKDAVDAVYAQKSQSFASISVKFGYDDGLMYEMEVISGGTIRFEEWSDHEYGVELAAPRIMMAVPKGRALELCHCLSQRQVTKIRKEPWVSMERHKERNS
jgi:hypothetical protein